jgi:hypothetical protein
MGNSLREYSVFPILYKFLILLGVLAKDRAIRLKVGDRNYEFTRQYYEVPGGNNDALLFHQIVSVKGILRPRLN